MCCEEGGGDGYAMIGWLGWGGGGWVGGGWVCGRGGGCGCVFMFRNTHPCGLYINSGAAGHSTLQFEETGSSSLT